MDEHIIDVQLPDGTMGKSIEVPITESVERFSEFTLADGTIIRVKTTILGASRNMGRFGPDGSPEYNLKVSPMINFVIVPDNLKRRL